MAEFRRDYHILNDVHLSLAELDTTPWGNPAFHQFLPNNKWHRRAKPPAWPQPRFSRAISPNKPDKGVNDDDFFWVSGNFKNLEAQIPGDRINWNKGVAVTPTSMHSVPRFDIVIEIGPTYSISNQPTNTTVGGRPGPRYHQPAKHVAVVAFLTTQPSSSRPNRASTLEWVPKVTYKNRAITDLESVVAEKDHSLAFNLAKSVCLPADMEHHDHLTKLKAIRSATKSMVLALQKNHVAHKRMLEL
ncbi:hypothetical protein CsSME_00008300 [Camellia sinensis var. sinensis]